MATEAATEQRRASPAVAPETARSASGPGTAQLSAFAETLNAAPRIRALRLGQANLMQAKARHPIHRLAPAGQRADDVLQAMPRAGGLGLAADWAPQPGGRIGVAVPAVSYVVRPLAVPIAGGVVQRVGGPKFGLEVTGDRGQAAVVAGIQALKETQAAYKLEIKTAKDLAFATFQGGDKADSVRQATYTNALRQAEMTPAGLGQRWVAKGAGHTFLNDHFDYQGQRVATVRLGGAAYVQTEAAAAPGLSAIYKRHTLDGPGGQEYVDVGGAKLRRYAYRGITPPERRAYRTGQVLSPGNVGSRAAEMGHKFNEQTGAASDRVRDAGQGKITDLEWLNQKANTHLAQTPNDRAALAFLQVRKGVGKAFSTTSTPKPITSNAGAGFAGFGSIKIDLSRVPTANVLHHYKAPAFSAVNLSQTIRGNPNPTGALTWETDRANETVIRNREIVLSEIPHAAVAELTDTAARTAYEARFEALYTPAYKNAYAAAMRDAGLTDAAPDPAVFPWEEDHFTAAQATEDFDAVAATAAAANDAAPRVQFAAEWREAYPLGWERGYEDAAWESNWVRDNAENVQGINAPGVPAVPAVPAGAANGTSLGFAAGEAAGSAAGVNYQG